MTDISSWDVSAANNDSAPPDGFPELQAPSTVNNAAREVMAAVRRYYDDIGAVNTSGGSSNAYTLTASQTISSYAAGQWFAFVANHANTGAATLSVDSLAAKAIKKNHDQDLESGDIKANQIVVVYYQATDDVFEMVSSVATNHAQDWMEAVQNSQFSVYRAPDQSISSDTWTKILFNNTVYDVGGNLDSNGYKAPQAGKYLITAFAEFATPEATRIAIYKNGSREKFLMHAPWDPDTVTATTNPNIGGAAVLDLAQNDNVSIYVHHSAGSSKDIGSVQGNHQQETWMQVARVA